MKKALSLLIALALVLACGATPTRASSTDGELAHWSVLAQYSPNMTPEEARSTHTYAEYEAMFAAKGIQIDVEFVNEYATTLLARIAAGDMPDLINADNLGSGDRINLIATGRLHAIDDLLPYGDGTAAFALSPQGYMYPCREKDTFSDGKLYYFGNGSMQISVYREDFGYNAVTGNTYSMKVRKDWLDALDLALPTTLDEFFGMLVAFNQGDANGNGVHDERLAIQTGSCNSTWGGCFDNGVAQWFGLAPYAYQLDRRTWTAQVPFLQEGFVPYIEFLRKCVDAGMLYLSDSVGKSDGALTSLLSQDVASAYFYQAHVDMSGTPEHAVYATLPSIVGQEGVAPVLDGSRGLKAWSYWGISSAADPQTAANFLDVVLSVDWAIFIGYGTQGKTYEILESGLYEYTGATTKAEQLASGWCSGGAIIAGLPYMNLPSYIMTYRGEPLFWNSYAEYLASDYFGEYLCAGLSEQAIANTRAWCGIAEELYQFNMNGDLTMVAPMTTQEEAAILAMYETDLYTYMDELFANLLSGAWLLDGYEGYVEELYAYGLQQVLEVQQARYDRMLGAKGRGEA